MIKTSRQYIALSIYCLLFAFLLTAPASLHLNKKLIGDTKGDLLDSVWGYWWFAKSLSFENVFPTQVTDLFFPDGGRLVIPDPINAYIATLFGAKQHPIVAYNLVIILHITLAGIGAFCLARVTGASVIGALIAATALMSHGHLLALITEGVPSATGIGWIAFSVAALIHASKTRKIIHACLTGVLVSVSLLAGHYHGAQVMLMMIWLFFWHLAHTTERKTLILNAVIIFIVTLVVSFPFQYSYYSGLVDTQELRMKSRAWNIIEPFDNTNLEFFLPFVKTPAPIPRPDYIGFVFCGLALYGLWRKPLLVPWFLLCIVFFCLSLGGKVYFRSAPIADFSMPLEWFNALLPLSFLRNAFRFQAGGIIALVPLCAFGVTCLYNSFRYKALSIGVLLVVDNLFCSGALSIPTHQTIAIPEAYTYIRRNTELKGAVLDIPIRFRFHEAGYYEFYQTIHHHPIPYNISEKDDLTGINPLLLTEPFIIAILMRDSWFSHLPDDGKYVLEERISELIRARNNELPTEYAIKESVQRLKQRGFRFVTFHEEWVSAESLICIREILNKYLQYVPDMNRPGLYILE